MNRLFPMDVDLHTVSPLNLAFVGDGVYEIMVRERLVCLANRPNKELHQLAVKQVRAEAQAAALDKIFSQLTEQEALVYRRGRNAHTSRTGGDYHKATGFEALFGFLYLSGQTERLQELFELILESNEI
ncbi:MAG: ribonuclease III [Clostridia bacterium]|nr:ribonuclease III [Clostridia bacterium]